MTIVAWPLTGVPFPQRKSRQELGAPGGLALRHEELTPFGHTAQESEKRPLAVGGGEAEKKRSWP